MSGVQSKATAQLGNDTAQCTGKAIGLCFPNRKTRLYGDLHLMYLIILDAVLGELVDMKPEGVAEVVDSLALLGLKKLKRYRQNGPITFKTRSNLF